MSDLRSLLAVESIYLEPAVEDYPRGREILARFPGARRIPVASHWRIPELHGNAGLAEDWLRTKRTTLVLGVKKSMAMRRNGRSADFIAPSTSNGCAMACAYCYVPRRKGYANPISVFVNCDDVCAALARHARKLGPKREPNQIDPSTGSTTSARTGICRWTRCSATTSATSSACSGPRPTRKAPSPPKR